MRKYIKSLLVVGILASGLSAEMIRIDAKEVVYDSDTKLLWQDNSDAKTVMKDWQGAIDYCENLTLVGHDDWKLPDMDVLKALYPEKGGLQNLILGYYWSSTVKVSNTDFAWGFAFYSGLDYDYYKNYSYYVRCVRAVQSFDPLIIEAEKIAKQKRIEAQKIAEAKQKHEDSWNKASSTNTIASYKEYLKNYPNDEYTTSAKSRIESMEYEKKYTAVLGSKDPQSMYLAAVKYENKDERGRAKKIYLTIMDNFEKSPMAVKAADRLAALGDVEAVEDSNRAKSNAIREATKEATRQNSNNSRQQCQSNKSACEAGCKGIYDSYKAYQCEQKCNAISCY